jgi:hypothetical protein
MFVLKWKDKGGEWWGRFADWLFRVRVDYCAGPDMIPVYKVEIVNRDGETGWVCPASSFDDGKRIAEDFLTDNGYL